MREEKGLQRGQTGIIGLFSMELGGGYIIMRLSRPLEVYITKNELQCMQTFFN